MRGHVVVHVGTDLFEFREDRVERARAALVEHRVDPPFGRCTFDGGTLSGTPRGAAAYAGGVAAVVIAAGRGKATAPRWKFDAIRTAATFAGRRCHNPCGTLAIALTRVGPRATENREPRQDRKGATVSGLLRVPRITWPSSGFFYRRNVQQLTAVLAAIGSAIVVLGGYHLLVAAPALRRLRAALATHDELLGGGAGASATKRVDQIEARVQRLEAGATSLAGRVSLLEAAAQSVMPRVGFVRYNAFDDVGSDLSYALALLTRDGNGVVLSSIYSREETRTYGKAVENFIAAQDASAEEKMAIAKARAT